MDRKYDKIIIGAGLYGLYAAKRCSDKGEKVLVLEYDRAPFQRATYINQARVHMGSLSKKPYDSGEISRIFQTVCRGLWILYS